MKKISIVFFGNSAFSVTILNALVQANFDIRAVITSPDEPKGRGGKPTPPPTALYAKEHGLPLLQSTQLDKNAVPSCDLGVIASYGHIIPDSILSVPSHGTLNVHPSLLPHYRGPTPIQTALANGDTSTGTTIMLTDKEMDHGPIIAQESITIDSNDSAITLEEKLARTSANLLVDTIPAWIEGRIQARPQDHANATFTKMLTKESGHICWDMPARDIINSIRAYKAWPTSWNILDKKNFKIINASISDIPRAASTVPGTLITHDGKLYAAANDFLVHLETIQPSGGKPMAGKAFFAGLRVDISTLKLL
ncbi:MAG: methionyl-tRNA formyltransferase [Patescibacteria group bacterium]